VNGIWPWNDVEVVGNVVCCGDVAGGNGLR
jgi:hypothetical protein